MSTPVYNNFELLLIAASELCVEKKAKELSETEPLEIPMSERQRRRMDRLLGRHDRHRHKPLPARFALKIACIALVVFLSASFTACVCIPKIREAIRDVLIEWFGDYVSVSFGEETDEEQEMPPALQTPTEPSQTETGPLPPPTTIEQKAYIANLPEGYRFEVKADNTFYYSATYYDTSGVPAFIFDQKIIDKKIWSDAENTSMKKVFVNSCESVLFIDDTIPSLYTLIWDDGKYRYSIYGMFSSEDEIIMYAENLRLSEGTP